MILVGITLLLVAAIAVNHIVHGFGCWGLQPGGPTSAMTYDFQILTAVIGILWLLSALIRRTVPCDALRLFAIGFFALLSVLLFMLFGWTAHTSIHHLGAENLVAYLTVAATTYLVGRYGHRRKKADSETNRKPSASARDAVQIPRNPSDNPYEPPQTIASSSSTP